MTKAEANPDKELFKQLRLFTCAQLWQEMGRFDAAPDSERPARAAVVRAVGTVFAESGSDQQKEQARQWLRPLWRDPCEKIRRYAIAALPKLGADPSAEAELLALLASAKSESEKRVLAQTLEKIGGAATLERIRHGDLPVQPRTVQKVQASLARQQQPSVIRLDQAIPGVPGFRIHLHCREGLEGIVCRELKERGQRGRPFRVLKSEKKQVTVTAIAPFTLRDLYQFRCFGSVGLVLGATRGRSGKQDTDAMASVITSPAARRLLQALTEGPIRYRLDFVSEGHQRGAVRLLAERVYQHWPQMLNDSQQAPWTIAIAPTGQGSCIELRPHFARDPRFDYRQDDVPAASHPPLAACLARLAGPAENEVVWDPFCGSGLELIERALLGGVQRVLGADLSPEALAAARANFAAAKLRGIDVKFVCADFRQAMEKGEPGAGSVSLVITNPPLGRRVPVPSLPGLIRDLFVAAARVLRPGGRLVFVNPVSLESPTRALRLEFRQVIDLGGFKCRLELYRRRIGEGESLVGSGHQPRGCD